MSRGISFMLIVCDILKAYNVLSRVNCASSFPATSQDKFSSQARLFWGLENTRGRQLEKHAQFDSAVSWSTSWWCDIVWWNCISELLCMRGGGGVGVVKQASRPYKAKGMPGWIRIRAGWERGARKVREGLLGLGCRPTEQGAQAGVPYC